MTLALRIEPDVVIQNKICEIKIINLGLIDYQQALEKQRDHLQELIAGNAGEALYLCEHPPVITHGRTANRGNVLASAGELKQLGIQIYEVERGGDCTWHGPGQLVAYPLLDLRTRKQDVSWYLRKLEAVIIRTLSHYQIEAQSICGKTGVWVQDRKIASIGVKLSRWCSMHGFSLNYQNCQSGFSLIRACGLPDLEVTSIIQERPNLSSVELTHKKASETLVDCFLYEFSNKKDEEEKTSYQSQL